MYTQARSVVDLKPEDYPEGWGTPRGMDTRQEGACPAYRLFHLQTLRVNLAREKDGRVTLSSPQLDIATFGDTELQAWESFLAALADVRDFYFENKATLTPLLRHKLRVLESAYVIEVE